MKNNRNGQAAILKPEEYASIRKEIKNEKYKLLLDLGWFTGERWGAILKLETSDIYNPNGSPRDFITFKAQTRKADPSGTRKTRQVPTHSTLKEVLKNYQIPHGSKFLFPNRNGDAPMKPRYADRVLRKAVDRAGLTAKGIATHSTRRTFITRLWENGTDMLTLKEITGHQSYQVLQGYVQTDTNRMIGAINSL